MSNLLCGHPPCPHGPHTTGTGHFKGVEICWDCSTKLEQFYFGLADRYTAYVSGNYITTWPGGLLARIYSKRRRSNNFAGELIHVEAVDDATGALWYGDCLGEGMYIRLRRRSQASQLNKGGMTHE